jgi:hypothetical protein
MKRTSRSSLLAIGFLLLAPGAASADWASEVAASNPLNWLRFNETSGITVADSGSDALAGELVGGASLGHPAVQGSAIHLDGAANGHVLLAGEPLPTPWTLEAIFYQDATTTGPSTAILGPEMFGAPNTAIKAEQWNSTGQLGYTAFGVIDETFDGPAASTPTSYTHVAMVGTDSGVSLFVNGLLADSEDTPIVLPRFWIGHGGLNPAGMPIDPLGGYIDELVIYDRELSAADIASHAAAAAIPEPGSFTLLVVGLIGIAVFWRRGR